MSHSYRGFITIAEYKKKIRMDYSPKLDFVGFYGVRRRSQTLKLSNSQTLKLSNSQTLCSVTNPFTVAPLLSIGLFGFAWTSLGPPQVHWIAPMIFSTLIAIANVSY
jgi:hypothetical protein